MKISAAAPDDEPQKRGRGRPPGKPVKREPQELPAELAARVNMDIPEEWFNEVRIRAQEFTGVNMNLCVELKKPLEAARALWMLAQGITRAVIQEATGLSWSAIRDLGFRHSDTLESKRKEFSREYAKVAMDYKNLLFMKAEQLERDPEQLKQVSPDKLAVTMAIATDKAMALSGMAGVVIEHRKGVSIEDAATAIAAARARIADKIKAKAIEAEVIVDED